MGSYLNSLPQTIGELNEALEEVAIRYRELFIASGGADLRYIPALNQRPDHLRALAGLLR